MHKTVGPIDLMRQKQHEEVNKQRILQLLFHWQPYWNVNLVLSKFLEFPKFRQQGVFLLIQQFHVPLWILLYCIYCLVQTIEIKVRMMMLFTLNCTGHWLEKPVLASSCSGEWKTSCRSLIRWRNNEEIFTYCSLSKNIWWVWLLQLFSTPSSMLNSTQGEKKKVFGFNFVLESLLRPQFSFHINIIYLCSRNSSSLAWKLLIVRFKRGLQCGRFPFLEVFLQIHKCLLWLYFHLPSWKQLVCVITPLVFFFFLLKTYNIKKDATV